MKGKASSQVQMRQMAYQLVPSAIEPADQKHTTYDDNRDDGSGSEQTVTNSHAFTRMDARSGGGRRDGRASTSVAPSVEDGRANPTRAKRSPVP